MNFETLPLLFLGYGLMALGFLALMAGFFLGLLSPENKFEQAAGVFVAGITALVIGGWLMAGNS